MRTLLTTKGIEGLKPKDKRYDLGDSRSPNLILAVQPTGAKSWRWRGRIDGKVTFLTLGPFPLHSLSEAREWADNITTGRNAGRSIGTELKKLEAANEWEQSFTLDKLFDLYMEHEGESRRSSVEKRRVYDKNFKPALGSKLVKDLDHDDFMLVIRAKSKTAPIQANHMVALIRRAFRWATTIGRDLTKLKVNPAADVVKLAKGNSRTRYLNDYEIGLFLKALPLVNSTMGGAALFILYTGSRKSEAYEAVWNEFDLQKGEWCIPGARTKNGMDHLLPLPEVVVKMLKEQAKLTAATPPKDPKAPHYVWSGKDGLAHSGFTRFMGNLMAKMNWLATKDGNVVAPFTLHDLRRTLSSGMHGMRNERGRALIPSDVVERILNHKLGGVAGVYNRWDYYGEKKDALELWANHIDEIKTLFEINPTALPSPPLALPAPTEASAAT